MAKEFRIDWKTVKELDKQYMHAQLKRFGTPAPRVIGIDEISVKKGHLVRRRAIWFGGKDRKEKSMDLKKIQLAVMDMWVVANSAEKNIPHADILYDKFHVMKHLGEWIQSENLNIAG